MALTINSRGVSELGRRFRVDSLILQARATLNAVAGDPLVSKALGASFIAKMKEKVERLESSFKNRKLTEERAQNATLLQNAAAKEADAWRREFTELVKSALRYGADVPRDGGRMGRFYGPGALAGEVERLVEYERTFASKLAEVGVAIPSDLLKQGTEAAAALRQADAMQEHLRSAERGEAVQELRRQVVAVLNAVRDVNGKARTVYKRDLKKAAPFNMRLLKRKSRPDESPSFAVPSKAGTAAKASESKPPEGDKAVPA